MMTVALFARSVLFGVFIALAAAATRMSALGIFLDSSKVKSFELIVGATPFAALALLASSTFYACVEVGGGTIVAAHSRSRCS